MLWNLTGSRLHCKEKNVCPETPVENHSSTFLEKRLGTASTCLRGWSLAGLSIDAPCDITKGPFTEQCDLWHNTEKNGANDRSKGRTSQFCVGELEASYRTKFDIVSSSVKLLGKMYGLVTLRVGFFFSEGDTQTGSVCEGETSLAFSTRKKTKTLHIHTAQRHRPTATLTSLFAAETVLTFWLLPHPKEEVASKWWWGGGGSGGRRGKEE